MSASYLEDTDQTTPGFREASRHQASLLAPLERRALTRLAAWMPSWVGPDHLSILGLAAMLLAGLFYFGARYDRQWLHLVNLMIALNWFGDSLDGTLARYRRQQRPRYGFYVDHIIDTFGAFFLICGLAASGLMSERIAFGTLAVFFMLAINSYLAAYAVGKFTLSFWKFGPTELRILLIIGNLFLIRQPTARLFGSTYLLYDVGGIIGVAGMALMLVVSAIRNTRFLYRAERINTAAA
jgi:phosphatidylglycerophosphate synthase